MKVNEIHRAELIALVAPLHAVARKSILYPDASTWVDAILDDSNTRRSKRERGNVLFKDYPIQKKRNEHWTKYLLLLIGLKHCAACDTIQPTECFNSCNRSGIRHECKKCAVARNKLYAQSNPEIVNSNSRKWAKNNRPKKNAQAARRKAAKLNATPLWADKIAIDNIYTNTPQGHHVDHIVPLQGVNVCGLHVEYNLQYLPAKENLRKSNKFEG